MKCKATTSKGDRCKNEAVIDGCCRRHSGKEKGEVYYTHDNGGRPFRVEFHPKVIDVFEERDHKYDTKVLSIPRLKSEKIWMGKKPDGHVILIQPTKGRYIFIGYAIFEFTSKDPVLEFHSKVGNSDVIYSYAVTPERHIFLTYDVKYVRNKDMDMTTDVFINAWNKKIAKNMRIKNIRKRLYG